MIHHQILVHKLTIRSNFHPQGSNKLFLVKMRIYQSLIYCEKMAIGFSSYRKFQAFRDFYSRFLISCRETAVDAFQGLSVPMTSSAEVVRTKKVLGHLRDLHVVAYWTGVKTEFIIIICISLII